MRMSRHRGTVFPNRGKHKSQTLGAAVTKCVRTFKENIARGLTPTGSSTAFSPKIPTPPQAQNCVSQELAIEGLDHRFHVTNAELERASANVVKAVKRAHPGLSGARRKRRR